MVLLSFSNGIAKSRLTSGGSKNCYRGEAIRFMSNFKSCTDKKESSDFTMNIFLKTHTAVQAPSLNVFIFYNNNDFSSSYRSEQFKTLLIATLIWRAYEQ